jgi:hypothetical protein
MSESAPDITTATRNHQKHCKEEDLLSRIRLNSRIYLLGNDFSCLYQR